MRWALERQKTAVLFFALLALLLLVGPCHVRAMPLPPRPLPPGPLIVEVTAVQPFGPAYRAGLEVGDRILEIGRERVRTLPDLRRLLLAAGDCAHLRVEHRRSGRTWSVYVYPEDGRIGIDARQVALPPPRYPY